MLAPYLGKSRTGGLHRRTDDEFVGTAIPVEGDNLDTPLYTGRHLITLDGDRSDYLQAINSLKNSMQMRVAVSSDFQETPFKEEEIRDADIFLYEDIGVALVSTIPGEQQKLAGVLDRRSGIVEPELVMYAIPFQETIEVTASSGNIGVPHLTWGINATGCHRSPYNGARVKVAILDTGLDLEHPDFIGRVKGQQSFVPGITDVWDLHGHGTHCAGIACAHCDPALTRYGVARLSDLYVGKILDHSGRGAQSWAINGINWAVSQQCKVISMSIGSIVLPGISYMVAYERAISNAVEHGALVVAAAGNDSQRTGGNDSQRFGGNNSLQPTSNDSQQPGRIFPVSSPANCPSAVAVTAVDSSMRMATFANSSINPGQNVFIAGPGVDIYSSWPMSIRYRSISGTSMATPFVSGIAALLWEKYPSFNPLQIKDELRTLARRLPDMPPSDIGWGFVQAPDN